MLLKGDCIEVMKAMKPNSVDAIVTDPPYGLEFMGKEWDKLWDKREFGIDEYSKKSFTCSDGSTRKTNPVSRKLNNPNYKAGIEAQLWHTQWLTEAYRVLKPGGSMLVMGGTRTSHRLACAIEDSGFIIKDTLMWIYGSGFPKAQDLGKMIDKRMGKSGKFIKENPNARPNSQPNYSLDGKSKNFSINVTPITKPESDLAKYWDGFKVGGIKPAYESIIWAVKPPEGSYVDNILKWGVGAVNVDECRIGSEQNDDANRYRTGGFRPTGIYGKSKLGVYGSSKGRFPANVILSHHPECVQVGVKKSKAPKHRNPSDGDSKFCHSEIMPRVDRAIYDQVDKDGYETVESWDCHPDCAVRLLDEQSGTLKSGARKGGDDFKLGRYKDQKGHWGIKKGGTCEANSGGASRFFKHCNYGQEERKVQKPLGRFPANIILSHHPECVQVGMKKIKPNWSKPTRGKMDKSMFNVGDKQKGKYISHDDPDGLETVESWDCHPDCAVRLLDEQSGVRQSKWGKDAPDKLSGNINYVGKNRASQQQFRGDSGGSSRFFKQCNYGQEEWLCHGGCALRQLDEQSGILKSGANPERRNSAKTKTCYGEFEGQKECMSYRGQNSGGASRFLYCAKASRGERNAGLEAMEEKSVSDRHGGWGNEKTWIDRKDGKGKVPVNAKMTPASNNHPTVKPIKLFEWLIKLVTREGQIVLDPFIGSGTTIIAAHNTGRKCMGIEKEEEYIEIAKRRATHWRSRPRQLEII